MEEQPLVQEITLPLYLARGWMRFLGVMFIIQGVMIIFTLIGILFCWIPIWLGILLFKTAGLSETAYISGQKGQLVAALDRLKTFFIINGVLILVMVGAWLVGLLIFGASLFSYWRQI